MVVLLEVVVSAVVQVQEEDLQWLQAQDSVRVHKRRKLLQLSPVVVLIVLAVLAAVVVPAVELLWQ